MNADEKERLKYLFEMGQVGGGSYGEGFYTALSIAERMILSLGGCKHTTSWKECFLVCEKCWQELKSSPKATEEKR